MTTPGQVQDTTKWWPVEYKATGGAENPYSVLCFRLPASLYDEAGQQLFDMKVTPDGQSNVMEAYLLHFLEMISRINRDVTTLPAYVTHRASSPERASQPWMKAYVEMVPRQQSEEQKRVLKDNLTRLLNANRNVDPRYVFWPPGTPLAEIRFWVLIYDPFYSLTAALDEMLEEASQSREKFEKNKVPITRNRGSDVSSLPSDVNPTSAVTINSWPYQQWMKIGRNELLVAVSTYMQHAGVAMDPQHNAMSIHNPEHPAHPLTAFNPVYAFCFTDEKNMPDEAFTDIRRYFAVGEPSMETINRYNHETEKSEEIQIEHASIQFTFPVPEYVLGPIPPHELTPQAMYLRYAPMYQFNNYWSVYAGLVQGSRPISEYQLRAVASDRPVPAPGASDDSNADQPPAANVAVQNQLIRRTGERTEVLTNSLNYWEDWARKLGGGGAAFTPTTHEMRTNRLSTFDWRRKDALTNGSIAGNTKDKLKELRFMCAEQLKQQKKQSYHEAAEIWKARAEGKELDEYTTQEYAHLTSKEQLERAVFRRAFEMFQENTVASVASFLTLNSTLQTCDAHYAKFGATMVGKVLSREVNMEIPIIDKDLTVFGNFVAYLMQQMEDVEMFSAIHSVAVMMWFGRFSCLRRKLGMVINFLLYGKAGTTKSFALDKTEEQSIPGTTETTNQSSAKALFTDEANNGIIKITHELSEDLMNSRSAKADSQAINNRKDLMTRGRIGYEVFYPQQEGGRKKRVVISEHNSCHYHATNNCTTYMDKALWSRYFCFMSREMRNRFREHKTPESLAVANGTEPETLTNEQNRFNKYSQFMQELIWLTEELIACRALPEPTLFCTTAAISQFAKGLEAVVTNDEARSRTYDRIKMEARDMVLVAAINSLFFDPGALYADAPFHVKQLLDLETRLVDDKQIAILAVTLFSEALEDTMRTQVLKAIALDFQNRRKVTRELATLFKITHTKSTVAYAPSISPIANRTNESQSASSPGNAENGPGAQAHARATAVQAAITATFASVPPVTSSFVQLPAGMTKDDAEKIAATSYDWSWVHVNHGFMRYSGVVHQIMKDHPDKFPYLISHDQIREVLTSISHRVDTMQVYEAAPSATNLEMLVAGSPVSAVNNAGQPAMMTSPEIATTEHNGFDVHYSLIKEALGWIEMGYVSTLEALIDCMNDSHTTTQKIVYGITEPDAPFVFKTTTLKPDASRHLVVRNPFYRSQKSRKIMTMSYKERNATDDANSRDLETPAITLTHSLELECLKRHMHKLGFNAMSDAALAKFSIAERDKNTIKVASERPGYQSIDYPSEYIRELTAQNDEQLMQVVATPVVEAAEPAAPRAREEAMPGDDDELERLHKRRRM